MSKRLLVSMMLFIPMLSVSISSFAVKAEDTESAPLSFLSRLSADMIVSLGLNTWGIADNEQNVSGIVEVELAPLEDLFEIRPTLHLDIGDRDEGYYSLGVSRYFSLNGSWSAGIGFQAGYLQNVASLGYELEFYSRFLLVYHLDAYSAVRLEAGHISNAGFGDVNPGSENLGLSYSYYF